MRRHDHIRQSPERIVARGRLKRETVEARARDPARFQRLDQRLFIHDLAARRVDQQRAGLHEAEFALADQIVRLRSQRAMQADVREKLIKRIDLPSVRAECCGRSERII
jgi:hypothetical protein